MTVGELGSPTVKSPRHEPPPPCIRRLPDDGSPIREESTEAVGYAHPLNLLENPGTSKLWVGPRIVFRTSPPSGNGRSRICRVSCGEPSSRSQNRERRRERVVGYWSVEVALATFEAWMNMSHSRLLNAVDPIGNVRLRAQPKQWVEGC